MNLTANHLPVLTWNHLKLNEANVILPEDGQDNLLITGNTYCKEFSVPAGICLEQGVDDKKLRTRFDELGIDNPKEKIIAGKFPIYDRQRFGTGMGAEIDSLFEKLSASTQIFTVDNSYCSDEPVILHYEYPRGEGELSRIFIHAKAGSESSFLLYYSSKELAEQQITSEDCTIQPATITNVIPKEALIGAQTYVYLEPGAKVHLYAVQMLHKHDTFFHDIGSYSCERSDFSLAKLDLGARTVYEGLNEIQMGDKSNFNVDFGYLGLPKSKMDINYNDVFWGKKAKGRMYFKEALLGNAEKTFRGTIDFRQYSTGSEGDEQEDIILLGDDVVNKTIPLILCEEEDVDGRHASSIGSLAEDMLFYMQTRGISKRKAEEIMVRASISHISQMVPSEMVKRAVQNAICRVFE